MKRLIALAAACLLLTACTTTNVRLASSPEKPPPNARVLTAQPDVELSLLTASGLPEPRADWSVQGRDNIAAAVRSSLDARGLKYAALDPAEINSGRTGQLLRLNNAVGQSIMLFNYGLNLPTHKGSFNWTIGDGAKDLGQKYQADYALFMTARGSYSSSGRKVMMFAAAAVGVSIPLGGQQVSASLVDLRNGHVIWYNVAQASPDADMRSPEGAQSLITTVLKTAPF